MNASCYVTGGWPRSLTQGLGCILVKQYWREGHVFCTLTLTFCLYMCTCMRAHTRCPLFKFVSHSTLVHALSVLLTCLIRLCVCVCVCMCACVRVCACLCSSVKFPLHSPPPPFSLSPSICLSYSLSCKCWIWPVMCCSIGIHTFAEEQSWLPAGKVVARGPSFTVSASPGASSEILE